MQIVTLTSDWQNDGLYIGPFKGSLLHHTKNVNVVDICHTIKYKDIAMAAFVLKHTAPMYPDKTIHVSITGTESNADVLVLSSNNQWFITSDNGLAGLLFENEPELIYKISNAFSNSHPSFPELELLIPPVVHLIQNSLDTLNCVRTTSYKRKLAFLPTYDENTIIGHVSYIDANGNIISNITKNLFSMVGKNRNYRIYIKSKNYVVNEIIREYHSVDQGDLFALFSFTQLLEIGIKDGRLSDILAIDYDTSIRVNFL